MRDKYKKPKNCKYPYTTSDYCWSYANGIDDGKVDELIEREHCSKGCEYWTGQWEEEMEDEI